MEVKFILEMRINEKYCDCGNLVKKNKLNNKSRKIGRLNENLTEKWNLGYFLLFDKRIGRNECFGIKLKRFKSIWTNL